MADIKNFGLRGVASDLQLGKGGGRFIYDDVNGRFDFVLADGVTLEDVRASTVTAAGNVAFTGSLVDNSAVAIDFFVTEAMGIANNDNDTTLPTSAAVIDYVTTAVADFQGNLSISGDTGTDVVDFQSEVLNFAGGTNITSAVTNNVVTFDLDSSVTLEGAGAQLTINNTENGAPFFAGSAVLTLQNVEGSSTISRTFGPQGGLFMENGDDGVAINGAGISLFTAGSVATPDLQVTAAGDVTVANDLAVTGAVQFGSLTDGVDSVTNFETAADGITASDAAVPTSNAVITYVAGEIAALSSNLSISDGLASDNVDLLNDTLTFAGNATSVTTTVTDNTVTFGLADDVSIVNDLTVGGDVTIGGGTGGQLTGASLVSTEALVASSNLTLNGFLVDGIIDDDTMATASATTLATSESVKAYVDAQVTAQDIDIAGDTGTGAVDLDSQTLTVAGTINEIETSVSGQTITVGLVDNPIVTGNLQVGGRLLSDDITASTVTVDGDAIITGNLTVAGTQTIIDSTVVSIADAAILVNSDGAVVSAGLEANIGGVIESILYNPNEVVNPNSGDAGAWVFSDDLVVNSTAVLSDLVFTNLRASDNTDPNVISGFLSAAEGLSATDEKLPTANAVIEYVAGEIASLSGTLNFDGDTGTDSLDLLTGNLVFAGGTNITSAVTNDTVTFNLDDSITLSTVNATDVNATTVTATTGDITTVNSTDVNSTNVTATGTVQGGTVTDGTATITGGNITTTGTVSGGTLTDGTATITGGDITTTGTVDAGTVEFDSLSGTGAVSITDFVTTVTASDTVVPTSNAVATYVDNAIADLQGNITISDGVTTDVVDFQSDTLTFAGNATSVTTTVTDNTVTFGLADTVNIVQDLNVGGNITTGGGAGGSITGADLISAVQLVATDNVTINGFVIEGVVTDLANATVDTVATSSAIQNYIDAQVTAQDLDFQGDTGGALAVDLDSQLFVIAGGTNVNTAGAGQTLTVNLDDDISLTSVTATGAVQGGSITDGVATLSAGSVTGGVNATFSGTVQGGTLTDGTVTITGGDISGVDVLTATTGNIGTVNATTVDATTVEFDSLSGTGAISITDFVDTVTDSDTVAPTAGAVVDYVATQISALSSNLSISGDTGTDTVDLLNDTLAFVGGTNLTSTVTNNTVTVDLDSDILLTSVTTTGNVSVGGSLNSDNITAATITVTGDLIVQGTTTTVNSTEVEIADAVIRVNSDGSAVSAGVEANVGGVIKQLVYVPAQSAWVATDQIEAPVVEFNTGLSDGTDTITNFETSVDGLTNSDSAVPTSAAVTAYVAAQVTAVDLDFAGDTGTGAVDLDSQSITVAGGTNITTTAAGQTLTVDLDDDISLAGNVVFGGAISDGTTAISSFVTSVDTIGSNDNDTTVPTTAAVIDYVANNSGDGLLLRGAFTANSTDSSFVVGTVPSVAGRTYYGARVKLKVSTAFSGGSFDHILVKENGGAGVTIVAEPDADGSVVDTYLVEIDDVVLTSGADVVVEFVQANGTTAAVPTAGSVVATVEYNWI